MLVVNYNGNKPIADYFKFSVKGNNDADIVRFVVEKEQESLDLSNENYLVYVKCKGARNFVDKVLISENDVIISGSDIFVDWHLLRKHTQNDSLLVSVCFENSENEVVWQTQTITLKINNGVVADNEIENNYPTILQQLQAEIDELKKQGGGGSDNVVIEKVWLTYDDKKSLVKDILGVEDDGKNFINDSSRIWVNFKTSQINNKVESEVKNGRFVIRLDYPIRKKGISRKLDGYTRLLEHQPLTIQGVGARGYAPNFLGGKDDMSERRKNILLRSLIFINEGDIKTNDYGEKYIHKKVSLFDYINNMCQFYDNTNQKNEITLLPITNDWVNNNAFGRQIFDGYMDFVYPLGIPANCFDEDNNNTYFSGRIINKFFVSNGNFQGSFGTRGERNPHTLNIHKLSPAFATYTALKVPAIDDTYYYIRYLYSPYYVKKAKPFKEYYKRHNYLVLGNEENYAKAPKLCYMSAKPRCCVLNDDYETNEKAFIKKYPQAEQQIRLYCKSIEEPDTSYGDEGISHIPIFRMLITRK